MQSNVSVVCRFRPICGLEVKEGKDICVEFVDERTCCIEERHTFDLDYVFRPEHSQKDVYARVGTPLLEAVIDGYNATLLAYGQTSSGKTFTVEGVDIFDDETSGIMPRAIKGVFDRLASADENIEFTVKVSLVEIYREKIRDLLNPKRTNLQVSENLDGVYLKGCTEIYASSVQEVFDIMKKGMSYRAVSSTKMNACSSRSHSLFSLVISQKHLQEGWVKAGRLYFVDLAGSEKVRKTGADGLRLEEAKTINKSLSCLGNVINALTDGRSTHVPFRDSKLTRVLQESLGGNAKTMLVITCSPSIFNMAETVSTLRFGTRAKKVHNTPKVNKEMSVDELKLLLKRAQAKILQQDETIRKIKEIETSPKARAPDERTEGPVVEISECGTTIQALQYKLLLCDRNNRNLISQLNQLHREKCRLQFREELLEARIASRDAELKKCRGWLHDVRQQFASLHCDSEDETSCPVTHAPRIVKPIRGGHGA